MTMIFLEVIIASQTSCYKAPLKINQQFGFAILIIFL